MAEMETFAETTAGIACQGNACGDIQHTYENGCHIVINLGGRRIKASWGIMSKFLSPGERWPITDISGKRCLQVVVGNFSANYE
jgi:hypothetical protein